MKHLKLRILLIGLGLFVTSCNSFNWDPRPYVGDHVTSSIVNADAETVRCDQPVFDTYTCFDAENIAELKTAIDNIKDKSTRRKLQKKFDEVLNRK